MSVQLYWRCVIIMVKNIISYVLPFGGLIILFCSFHFFDKYAASSADEQIDADKPVD